MESKEKMKIEYFRKNREKMFPWVTDWADPQDHWRFYPSVRNLTYKMWFWFHPTAYHLLSFGISILGIALFSGLFWYSLLKHWWIVCIISLLVIIGNGWRIWKMLTIWEYIKDMNFYDLYLRDYGGETNGRV